MTSHFVSRLPEWASTAILLNFGMTLLRSGGTFQNNAPAFNVMARLASQDVWGWCLFIVAVTRLAALVFNGTFDIFARFSVYARATTATLFVGAYFAITLGIYLGSPSATGVETYACLMVVDIILAGHLAGQAGGFERARRNAG